MSCTLGPLVTEANQAATAAYTICEADPSGLTLSPDDLEIVEDTGAEVSVTTVLGAREDEYDVFGQMSKQFEMY